MPPTGFWMDSQWILEGFSMGSEMPPNDFEWTPIGFWKDLLSILKCPPMHSEMPQVDFEWIPIVFNEFRNAPNGF